jgi:predicted acylesterase/phospholipase RssA
MSTIHHLVLSGGGSSLFQLLGACQHLEINDTWKRNSLKSIYGTSAGAILAVLLCLDYDWQTLNDYLIKRPWKDAYKIDIQTFFDAYSKRGLFDIHAMEIFFKPLFDAKDIPLSITLQGFFDLYPIDLHFFTLEINDFKIHDISHLHFPDLPLLQSLQMTCAVPLLLSPVCIQGKCYIDGGAICNYPLKYCMETYPGEENAILGFKNVYSDHASFDVGEQSSLFEFLLNALHKLISNMNTEPNQPTLENEVYVKKKVMTLPYLQRVVQSMELRKELLEEGIACAQDYLTNLTNKKENIEVI